MNSTPLTRQLIWVATQSHSNLHPLQMRSSVPESSQDMGNFLLMEGRDQPLFYTYIVILVKEASILLPGLCKEIRSFQSIAQRPINSGWATHWAQRHHNYVQHPLGPLSPSSPSSSSLTATSSAMANILHCFSPIMKTLESYVKNACILIDLLQTTTQARVSDVVPAAEDLKVIDVWPKTYRSVAVSISNSTPTGLFNGESKPSWLPCKEYPCREPAEDDGSPREGKSNSFNTKGQN